MPLSTDQVWEEEEDGRPDITQLELARESETRRERYFNTGYRDGLDAGRIETVQKGFNEGFGVGFREGFAYGQVRGAAYTLNFYSKEDDNEVAGSSERKEKKNKGKDSVCSSGILDITAEEARRTKHEHRDFGKAENPHLKAEALRNMKKRLRDEENVNLFLGSRIEK